MAATVLAIEALRLLAASGRAEAFGAADYFADELAEMKAAKKVRQDRWRAKDPRLKRVSSASQMVSQNASHGASQPPPSLHSPLSEFESGAKAPTLLTSDLFSDPSQPSEGPKPNGQSMRVRASHGASPRKPAETADAWAAYFAAYAFRYRVEPLRNARVNGQMATFCRLVPRVSWAPTIEHYVRSQNARYVAAGHSVGCLLADAEKLCTEALTGRQGTAFAARDGDKRAGRGEQYAELIAQFEAEDAEESRGKN